MRVVTLFLSNPPLAFLSFIATVRSFIIAKKYFPETNSSNGIGNAFRHALWTSLIMMYCCKISSPEKSFNWTKKVTDLHEELFPNEPLETKMDLHNNKIGLDLFMNMLQGIHRQFFETSFLIDKIFEKLKTAQILENLEDEFGDNLVYLKEKPKN